MEYERDIIDLGEELKSYFLKRLLEDGIKLRLQDISVVIARLNDLLFEQRDGERGFGVYYRDPDDYNRLAYVFNKIGQGDGVLVLNLYIPSVSLYGEEVYVMFREWFVNRSRVSIIEGYLQRYA